MIRSLIATLLPPSCAACSAPLGPRTPRQDEPAGILCGECNSILTPLSQEDRCLHCGASPHHVVTGRTRPGRCSDCTDLPDSFKEALSVFPYQGPAGMIVRRLKYQRAPYLADWLFHLALPQAEPWLREKLGDAQIVPMPMNAWRELRRGYNQAEMIALALARHFHAPLIEEGTLRRVRHAKPQARYDTRAERTENLRGAYRVISPREVRGRRFLLVDDVMTTGATMACAAEALMDAGADKVFAFTPVRARLGEDAVPTP